MGKRRSVNSPAKWKRRNRRRIHCSRCGSNYSYSGSRSHVCPKATSAQSQTRTREEQVPDLDLNATSEEETGFDCLQDNSDTEEENTSPTRCDENADTEQFLSADLRRRLKDRLRKRFTRETCIILTMIAVMKTKVPLIAVVTVVKALHMVIIHQIPSMRTGVILMEAVNQSSQKRILPRDHKNKTIQCLSQINVGCSFIGLYCSYFPGSLDFLLQIQLWRCYLNFLVVFSG